MQLDIHCLNHACERGDLETVSNYIHQNFDCGIIDEQSFTPQASPLHWASWRGQTKIVDILLKHGNNVDINSCDEGGDTPLILAARNGHYKVVQQLIDFNANLNLNATNFVASHTALHAAAMYDRKRCVELLLLAGCHWDIRDYQGLLPIDIAKKFGREDVYNIIHKYSTSGRKRSRSERIHHTSRPHPIPRRFVHPF